MSKVIQGDCLEALKTIPEGTVDLILTDSPFAVTKAQWDKGINWTEWWKTVKPLLKPGAPVVMFAVQPFTTDLIMTNRKALKYCWVWDHHYPRGFQTCRFKPMSQHHDIIVFCDGKVNYYPIMEKRDKPVRGKIYGKSDIYPITNYDGKTRTYDYKNPSSIIRGHYDRSQVKPHPSHKPESLLKYLIETYTKPGELVVDPFAGSGSTALAAIDSGRQYIMIEKEQEFVDVINKRIAEHG